MWVSTTIENFIHSAVRRMFRARPGEDSYTVTSAEVDRAVSEVSAPVRAAGEGSAVFVPKSKLPIGPVKVGGSNPR